MKKRLLSSILSICVMLSMLPTRALAYQNNDGSSNEPDHTQIICQEDDPEIHEGLGGTDSVVMNAISLHGLESGTFVSSYYDQLDVTSKLVYDAILNSPLKDGFTVNDKVNDENCFRLEISLSENPISLTNLTQQNGAFTEEAKKSIFDEIGNVIEPAFSALLYDHPELSWATRVPYGKGYNLYSYVKGDKTSASCDINITKISFILYAEGNAMLAGNNRSTYDTDLAKAKNEIDTRLSGKTDKYSTARAIHDWICDKIDYEFSYIDGTTERSGYDQTVHSALHSRKTVCAGYARSFKVLCNAYGIPCVMVSGQGVTNSKSEAHMWNYIQMEDNNWYAVDCTWDDQTEDGHGIFYDFFLVGSNSVDTSFGVQAFSASHRASPLWEDTSGQQAFAYPTLSTVAYTATGIPSRMEVTFVAPEDSEQVKIDESGTTVTCVTIPGLDANRTSTKVSVPFFVTFYDSAGNKMEPSDKTVSWRTARTTTSIGKDGILSIPSEAAKDLKSNYVYSVTVSASYPGVETASCTTFYIAPGVPKPTFVDIKENDEVISGDNITAGQSAVYTTAVLDQYGYEMAGETVQWTVVSSGTGITVENGEVTVPDGTPAGEYELSATSGDATASIKITVASKGQHSLNNSVLSNQTIAYGSTYQTPQISCTDTDCAGASVSYSSSNTSIATVDANGLVKAVGVSASDGDVATITVSVAATSKHAAQTATYTVKVTPLAIQQSASGYSGTYDGQAHTIKVNVTEPASGATITYSDSSTGSFTETAPTYTDVGNHTVYYKVTAPGYSEVSGSAAVNITQATPTLSVSPSVTTLDGGGDVTITATSSPATTAYPTGKITVSVSPSKNGTITDNGNGTWTASLPNATQSCTFTASYTDSKGNYSDVTATCTVSVTESALNVTANGYNGVYDGKPHSISVSSSDSGVTITYSDSQNGTYSMNNPSYTDVGTYTVYYKVSKTGYAEVAGSQTVAITPATMEYSANGWQGTFDGHGHSITVSVTKPVGATVTYSTDNSSFSATNPPYTDPGTYTVYYQIKAPNYADVTGSETVKIDALKTITYTASDFTGTYDGNSHSISLEVTAPTTGTTVSYSTDGGNTYVGTNPAFTAPGIYVVHFKIEADGYETVTNSRTVTITSATISYEANGWEGFHDGNSHNVSVVVTTPVSGADVTYSTDGTTYSSNNPGFMDVGEYVVYFRIEATGYTTVTGSEKVTIKNLQTISYVVNGWGGYYDGSAHSIDVTVSQPASGASITYSTDGTKYEPSNPNFSAAGSYTVYFRIEAEGYQTVNGQAEVVITALKSISCSAQGWSGKYDGNAHSIAVTVADPANGAAITYSVDGTNYTSSNPGYTSTGSYTVYYKVEAEGYEPTNGSAVVEIQRDDTLSEIVYTADGWSGPYDGASHSIDLSVSTPADATITYLTDGGVTYGPQNPEFTLPGTYSVQYKIEAAGYETVTGTKTVVINALPMVYSSNGWTGEYDGSAHSIAVSVTTPVSGAVITYSSDGATYSPNNPGYTAEGTYTVHFRIAATGYETVDGTAIVNIQAASLKTIGYSVVGWSDEYDGNAHSIAVVVTEPASGAVVTYSTDGTTYTTSNPSFTAVGTHTVYFKIEATGYETKTGTATVEIKQPTPPTPSTIVYAVNGWSGEYDGSTHSISVVVSRPSSGSTITYSTDGTNYGASNPSFTAVGTYIVYYKIVASGYSTATGIATVEIKNAPTPTPLTISYTAAGWNGEFDGNLHSISVSVSVPEDAKIEYSTDGTSYSAANPSFSSVGTYNVYFRISADGYTTVNDSRSVEISETTPVVPPISVVPTPTMVVGGGTVSLTATGVPLTGTVTVTCDYPGISINKLGTNTYTAVLPNITRTYVFTVTYNPESGNGYTSATTTCHVSVTAYVEDPVPPSDGEDTHGTSDNNHGNSGNTSSDNKADSKPSGTEEHTTTKTDPSTGTVTQTTTHTDGSSTIVETKVDGMVTNVVSMPDGTTATAVKGPDGKVTAEVKLSDSFLKQSQSSGGAAVLPIPEVPVVAASSEASTVAIVTPSTEKTSVKVEIPVATSAITTVAVRVNPNGSEEIIKTSMAFDGMLSVTVPTGEVTVKIVDNSKSFVDTSGHWGEDAVSFVASRELFEGTDEEHFSPDNAMTRGMLMTVLARYDGQDTRGGSIWYEKGMVWAEQEGISDGTQPEKALSRQELVTMLYRYAGKPDTNGSLASFIDGSATADWAATAMMWAVENGIITGKGSGELDPTGLTTRAQVATILMRFTELMVK